MPKLILRYPDGREKEVDAPLGFSAMEAVHLRQEKGIEGACGGCLGCGTCHVYVADEWREKVSERFPVGEDEDDMLDHIRDFRTSSRLSCQIIMDEDMDGLILEITPAQMNRLGE